MKVIYAILSISLIASAMGTDEESKKIVASLDQEIEGYTALQEFEYTDGYGYSVNYGDLVNRMSAVRVFVYDLNKSEITQKDLALEFDRSVSGVIRDFGHLPGFQVEKEEGKLKIGEHQFTVLKAIFKYGKTSNSILFSTSNDKFIKLAVGTSRDSFQEIEPSATVLLRHAIEKTKMD